MKNTVKTRLDLMIEMFDKSSLDNERLEVDIIRVWLHFVETGKPKYRDIGEVNQEFLIERGFLDA